MNKDIARAAQILRSGGLVAFPTETVYGLGADASGAPHDALRLTVQMPKRIPVATLRDRRCGAANAAR